MCRTEVGLYGELTIIFFSHTKSFFGKYVRGTEPPEPGFGPDLGRRVHEEAEALGRSKDWSGPKLPSSRLGASGCLGGGPGSWYPKDGLVPP